MRLARWILWLEGPDERPAEEGSAERWQRQNERVQADMPAILEELEENATDLLPEGYRLTIEEKE